MMSGCTTRVQWLACLQKHCEKQISPAGPSGGDLFIVDNTDADWKVRDYLREWTEIAHSFDIATGFFEIGALLALDSHWQKLDGDDRGPAAPVSHLK
jgi:hypothetical protein